jgi:hypothetical protein
MRRTGRMSVSTIPMVCALAAACLWAATGAPDGVVKDSATGEPVPRVKITLVSAKSETLSYTDHRPERPFSTRAGWYGITR